MQSNIATDNLLIQVNHSPNDNKLEHKATLTIYNSYGKALK